jgi:hypothetical protein
MDTTEPSLAPADALDDGAQNAAWHQRQLVRLAPRHNRVTGIGPTLVANDHVVLLGEQVDDLSLGFISPLQPDDASTRHENTFPEAYLVKPAAPADNSGRACKLPSLGRCCAAGQAAVGCLSYQPVEMSPVCDHLEMSPVAAIWKNVVDKMA